MSVAVLLELAPREGAVAELLGLLAEQLPDTRACAGCERVEASWSEGSPAMVVAYERWASVEHYQRYVAWRVETGGAAALTRLLRQSPAIRMLELLDV